ncbi:MAG TPA: hypothetical protein DHW02_01115, partial [Ktedonobacter sp.]|nr:hypothetical protein [Ktedonobacter sp.]
MPDQNIAALNSCIERARKILQFEQRTNHQDQAVKPGGLASFVTRWADEACDICNRAGIDVRPIHSFTEYLEGYRSQDPMQRAASLRSALSVLNEMSINEASPTGTSRANGASTNSFFVKTASSGEQLTVQSARASTASPSVKNVEGKVKHDVLAKQTPVETSVQPSKAIPPTMKPKREEPSTSDFVRLEAGMSQGHTVMTLLTTDVTAIPGVGPSVAAKLNALGIRTVRDLLFYFPREHRDYSKLEKIANIRSGEVVTTMGMIWEVETKRLNGGARTITYATISDDTGKLRVSWFNQGYLQKQLQAAKGSYIVVTGTKQRFGNKVEFQVRSHELPEQGDLLNTGRLVPTYPLTEGLHAKTLRRFTKWAVDRYAQMLPDHLPAQIR